jgi:hypothetical protein
MSDTNDRLIAEIDHRLCLIALQKSVMDARLAAARAEESLAYFQLELAKAEVELHALSMKAVDLSSFVGTEMGGKIGEGEGQGPL